MATVKEQVGQRVTAVQEAIKNARGAWTGVGVRLGALVGVTPQSQVLNAITNMETIGFIPWSVRQFKYPENDKANWDRWIQDGNDLIKNLRDIAQDANIASLPAIVFDTVKESAKDVKTAAKGIWSAKYLIVAALAIVAIIIFKVKS